MKSTTVCCPNCGHKMARLDLDQAVGLDVAPIRVAPAPKRGAKPAEVCACGHDWHEGPCPHGRGTAFGGCECPAGHTKRQGTAARKRAEKATAADDGAPKLSKCARAVLGVLLRIVPRSATRLELGVHSVYAYSSGNFGNALSELRAAGLLEDLLDGRMRFPAGARPPADATVAAPPDGILEEWCGKVSKCARLILEAAEDEYPGELTREELGEATGYVASSGNFGNGLSELRGLGLLEAGGTRATDAVMREIGK